MLRQDSAFGRSKPRPYNEMTEGGHGVPCPCRISIMTSSDNKAAQTLAALGATEPARVSELFTEIVARFDGEIASVHDDASWKQFRDAWLGRKSGVLTLVTDNWLKPATPELKRVVGAELNKLRGHVEAQIEARRASIEAGADEAALSRE